MREEQSVRKGDLLARGTTRIFFQANRWVFTGLAFLLACSMGFGMAAVYTHIPTYFPREVGVVGGLVGVLGGLGGFFFPIIFGVLLDVTGLWTTCWAFLFIIAGACLLWMHLVIRRMMVASAPDGLQRSPEDNISNRQGFVVSLQDRKHHYRDHSQCDAHRQNKKLRSPPFSISCFRNLENKDG